MSEVQGQPRYRGFWPAVVSFVYSILFLVSIYLSCLVIFAGNWFLALLNRRFAYRNYFAIWRTLRFTLLFVILFLIIYGVYRLSAPRGRPKRRRFLGALLAAIVMVGASIFFSWTIELSVRYPLIYGSIASIIILMIWLFICGNILILGNIVNVVFYRRWDERHGLADSADEGEEDGGGDLAKEQRG